MADVVIGVDIGTSSSKGVAARLDGRIVRIAVREHVVSRPRPGWAEMPAEEWWREFCEICHELSDPDDRVVAVGVSGMGPCVLVTDGSGTPLRPAILYGIDTRAARQLAALEARWGSDEILERTGCRLSAQSAGPKIAWIADEEPSIFASARRFFMPASWLSWKLAGAYVLDHQSASQCAPLYDIHAQDWFHPWADAIVGGIELPRLVWADTVVGTVSSAASAECGLPAGIPVIGGSIDAWVEGVSVGATRPGDLMLMYGTTMFLVNTVSGYLSHPPLWSTMGAFPGSRTLAGGMATSGAVTAWLRSAFGSPAFSELEAEAERVPAGSRGVLILPYFAGERTPISDPDARGTIFGLTIEHGRGELYRAGLEATGLAVRHNVEAILSAGGSITRTVAVGGGAQSELWLQIVSDITGLTQQLPTTTIGASFGAAMLAAGAVSSVDLDTWNPIASIIRPRRESKPAYDELFGLYLDAYPAVAELSHALARQQRTLSDVP